MQQLWGGMGGSVGPFELEGYQFKNLCAWLSLGTHSYRAPGESS